MNNRGRKETPDYGTPEITLLGKVTDLTEGIESPNVEGYAGSGKYYNANPPPDKKVTNQTS